MFSQQKTDVFELIAEDDLTPDLRLLSEICGMEAVRQLLRSFGGISFYIPKLSRLDGFILKYSRNNSEKNTKLIARELGVSEQFLKSLLRRKKQV